MRLAALLITVGLLLSGCATPPPTPDPVMRNHAEAPVFKSDEDALAAAEEAYSAYLAVSDQISADGGKDPERIQAFVTEGQLTAEMDGFAAFRQNNWRTIGTSSFDTSVLQYSEALPLVVSMYVCVDNSSISVVNELGDPVSTPGPVRSGFNVVLTGGADGRTLLLDKAEPWPDYPC